MLNDNLICIIPIRSKSKGIKHKNIKMLKFTLINTRYKGRFDCKLFKIIIAIDSDIYKRRIQKYTSDKNCFFKIKKK